MDEARKRADRFAEPHKNAEPFENSHENFHSLKKKVDENVGAVASAPPAFLFVLDCKADLFCSARCASLDKQANSASELRKLLYARERGVCRACRWDASACARRIAVMRSRGARRKHILSSNPRFGASGNAKLLEQLVRTAWEGHAWHFDHIVAVYEGGGECSVDNGQTLCVLCHKARTAAQAKARADARRAAKRSSDAAPAPAKASRRRGTKETTKAPRKTRRVPGAPAETTAVPATARTTPCFDRGSRRSRRRRAADGRVGARGGGGGARRVPR